MELSFQYSQVFYILFYAVIIIAIWKLKTAKAKLAVVAIVLAFAFFNPVKFKHKGGKSLENNYSSQYEDIPARVIVEEKSFEERQNDELDALKKESTKVVQ